MKKRRMGVRLARSKKMDEGHSREDSYLRVPHRARTHFSVKGGRLTIEVGKNSENLEIKQAFKEDVQFLRRQVKEGELTEEEAASIGFVTTRVMKRLSGRKVAGFYDKDCYLSDSIEDLTLGADPEFALVKPEDKRYQYASYVIGKDGELGSDGPLAEVRPAPSTKVSTVVDTMKNILKRDGNLIDKFDWVAGASYRSPNHPNERVVHIGGHIHVGDPKGIPSNLKQGIYSQIIRILDEIIALPLVRIDRPDPHLRRNTEHNGYGRYGRWGDQRPQQGRFEWRVPSGLWLAHPDISRAVLGTTKAVSETCYQMMADQNFQEKWILARADRRGFLRAWNAMNANEARKIINDASPTAVTTTLINRAAKKLTSMENYSKYKEEIDEFLKLVRLSDKDRNNINLDIKNTWLNNDKLIRQG